MKSLMATIADIFRLEGNLTLVEPQHEDCQHLDFRPRGAWSGRTIRYSVRYVGERQNTIIAVERWVCGEVGSAKVVGLISPIASLEAMAQHGAYVIGLDLIELTTPEALGRPALRRDNA